MHTNSLGSHSNINQQRRAPASMTTTTAKEKILGDQDGSSCWETAGGVFLSTRTLQQQQAFLSSLPLSSGNNNNKKNSDNNDDTEASSTVDESSSDEMSTISSSMTTTTTGTVVLTSTTHDDDDEFPSESGGWKSSAAKEPCRSMPLMVSDPDKPDPRVLDDPAAALGKVMEKAKRLPKRSSSSGNNCYASNHIMVNEERIKRMIAPLKRLRELDDLARAHAESMAAQKQVFHMDPVAGLRQFHRYHHRLTTTRRWGENVARGSSLQEIHDKMIMSPADKNNLLDRRFTHMGMASVTVPRNNNNATSGSQNQQQQLYLCQIFRG